MNNTFAVTRAILKKSLMKKIFREQLWVWDYLSLISRDQKNMHLQTINGQDKLVFKNNEVECPVEYPEEKKITVFAIILPLTWHSSV